VVGGTVADTPDTDRVRLSAYWGPRAETADAAASRLLAFLSQLQEIDPYFSEWYRKGKSQAEALRYRVELTPAALKEVVLTGVSLRSDRTVDEELGFRFGLWDGRTDGCFLSVSCGITIPLFPNVFLFYFPQDPTVASRLLRTDIATRILEVAVRAWEPDWANIASEAYLKTAPNWARPSESPLPGWLLYLSAHRGELPPLAPQVEVVPVGNIGSIIVMASQLPPSATNGTAEHVTQTMQALASAGLLGPIPR
jgi:immunity protein 52 of polymorphic toxin system